MKKIPLSKFNKNLPNFENRTQTKDKIVLNWLCNWVENSLKSGEIEEDDLMPSKQELAELLKISSATLQNAIRHAEDLGYFYSKQRLGTFVSNPKNKKTKFKKSYSKKDSAKSEIKNLILELGLTEGSKLPSSRAIAREIATSHNTVCLALETLVKEGFLEQRFYKKNEKSWFLVQEIELTQNEKKYSLSRAVKNKTLAEIHEKTIKNYIVNNFEIGAKIPTTKELSKMFSLSIKTLSDIMQSLAKKGVISSRRGKYGTIYEGRHIGEIKSEKSLFMSGVRNKSQTPKFQYRWESAAGEIKKYIFKNCEIGDKTLTVQEFAEKLNVSTNTVRRAINELVNQGFLHIQRGRFGGIYVTDFPEDVPKTYKWLALN
ncbi:GntR family transcriptional regulator [bacterium]|nr:GntR family transcriptional regulator [bacterium]